MALQTAIGLLMGLLRSVVILHHVFVMDTNGGAPLLIGEGQTVWVTPTPGAVPAMAEVG